MADKKITQLTEMTEITVDDLLVLVDDPGGTPETKKMKIQNFLAYMRNGWFLDTNTWTYASATTFTVSRDVTDVFDLGTKVRLKQGGGWKYFYVVATSYSSPNTTITVTGGADYSLINAPITDGYLSQAASPVGFPQWFNHTPTFTGFSADPSGGTYQFCIIGRLVYFNVYQPSNGTSNSTVFTISLPVAGTGGACDSTGQIVDAGSTQATPGVWTLNGSILTLYKNHTAAVWTNTGGKRAQFTMCYRI